MHNSLKIQNQRLLWSDICCRSTGLLHTQNSGCELSERSRGSSGRSPRWRWAWSIEGRPEEGTAPPQKISYFYVKIVGDSGFWFVLSIILMLQPARGLNRPLWGPGKYRGKGTAKVAGIRKERIFFWRRASLNSGALAVPWQRKNSGAASGYIHG